PSFARPSTYMRIALRLKIVDPAELDLVARAKRHDRFFAIGMLDRRLHRAFAHVALALALDGHGVDAQHLHLEYLFDRRFDVVLRRVRIDFERILPLGGIRDRLRGHDRTDDDASRLRHRTPPPALRTRSS